MLWDKNRERKGKLQTFVFSYFPDKNIFGDDCFFINHHLVPWISKNKGTGYITAWGAKALYSRFQLLYTAFLSNIKRFGYKIGIQFNNIALAVERNNHLGEVVNTYELGYWPRNPLSNFVLIKNLLVWFDWYRGML